MSIHMFIKELLRRFTNEIRMTGDVKITLSE